MPLRKEKLRVDKEENRVFEIEKGATRFLPTILEECQNTWYRNRPETGAHEDGALKDRLQETLVPT